MYFSLYVPLYATFIVKVLFLYCVHMDENEDLVIDTPANLLPDLSLWSIEEVERGVCIDSYDNRKLLRENGATWLIVYTPDGRPTDLIQAVTSEMKQARLLTNKAFLLTDDRDPDSDYITGLALVLEPMADDAVPAWVLAASRKWLDIAKERADRGVDGKLFRPAVSGPPTRCRAKRMDGKRCQNWTGGLVQNDGLCKTHVGTRANAEDNYGTNIMQKARNRLISASIGALEGLEELSQTATSEPVRLGAYNSLLDRAGIRGGIEIDTNVNVNVVSAEDVVRERLAKLALRSEQLSLALEPSAPEAEPEESGEDAEDIVDAEVVEVTVEKND